jgi:hypothetical protein
LATCSDTVRGFLGTALGRTVCIGGIIYAALCVTILLDIRFPSLEGVGRPVLIVAITVTGPALLLSLGIEAWKLFVATITAMLGCLFFAQYLNRRFPESEIFAVPVLAAVGIWIGSGWLTVALGI